MTAPAGAVTTSSGGRTYPVQGRNLPGVSTVLGVLDKPGLNVWKHKRIAYAVAVDPNIRDLASSEDTLYRATRLALDYAPTLEADLGTDVHAATELYDLHGTATTTLPFVQPYLDRWIEARDEYGIVPVSVERTVANIELGYAGTYDRIVTLHHGEWTCGKWCESPNHTGDVKTGKQVWPDVAMQLAAYTNAPHLWTPPSAPDANDDVLGPRIPTCTQTGLVFALHADSVAIVPVHLVDAWHAVRGALLVSEWETVKSHALYPPLERQATALPW